MTISELIKHLETFDPAAVVVVPIADEYGDPCDVQEVKAEDIEGRGKYVILFDNMPYTEEDLDEILA